MEDRSLRVMLSTVSADPPVAWESRACATGQGGLQLARRAAEAEAFGIQDWESEGGAIAETTPRQPHRLGRPTQITKGHTLVS
jgi:hypothetical protein